MHGIDIVLFTLVASLAGWQAVEIWHHGSIFAGVRAWLEAHEGGFLPDLLLCPFCLSSWAGVLCSAGVFSLAFGPDNFEWHYLAALPFVGLAAARLSNLFNDLCRPFCRTPNRGGAEVKTLEEVAGGFHAGTPDVSAGNESATSR